MQAHSVALTIVAVVLALSSAGAWGDAYSRMPHGPGFRNVRDYGAKGDGVTDDTQAFIRALDEGRGSVRAKEAANVYVPPGTYLVSDTLIVWRATMLAGDADNPPTILLRDNAPGFDDPAEPKPVVVTALGYNIDAATRDWRTRTNELGGSTNNTFWITVRHINIRIGSGNPGAWGLYWLVAQQTALRHVTIDAGEGQGCMRSMWWGGGGAISHLRLLGGEVGWHVRETSQWVFRSVQLRGQRKHSIWLEQVWNFSLLDLDVRDTAPIRIDGGSVSIIDSRFRRIQGAAAIEANGTHLVLQNVAAPGAAEVVKGLLPGRKRTVLWATGPAMVDGQALQGDAHDLSATFPSAPTPLPSPEYPLLGRDAMSVTEFGAEGDGESDDTDAIRAAIAAGRDVFFPEGTYLVSDTIDLRPGTRLFGEMWSVISLAPDAAGFEDPSSRKPLLGIPADPAATLTVCHLQLSMETPGGVHCDWRAGERSMLIDSTFYSASETQELNWRISGEGGGVFENAWSPGISGDGLEITSTGRKWLYAVQQEHYRGTALILRGATHLTGLGLQFETSPAYVIVEDCEDIALFQTIAGNWSEPVASMIHVKGGRGIALFNSAVCRCGAVITEVPGEWSAGPSSSDRSFAQQAVWLKG